MRLRQKETVGVVGVGNFKLPGNLRVIHTVLPKNMVLLMA